MKRFLSILVAIVLTTLTLSAQNSEVGYHAPQIQEVEWISDPMEKSDKFLLVEFFHSTNEDCRARIEVCNTIARDYRHTLQVVMLTREPAEQVASMLLHDYQYFYVGVDEGGETFRAFGTSHVPYAVVIDPKGVIIWTGNPTQLNNHTLEKLLYR